jgi:FkbM family methyltransferase
LENPTWLRYSDKHRSTVHSIWIRQEYEAYRGPRRGEVVVDAGAGIGIFTVKASLQVGTTGIVYAFEPEPENYSLLEENTRSLRNVKTHRLALWSTTGRKTLHLSPWWGAHTLTPLQGHRETRRIEVKAARLDDLVSTAHFLKIDVEGAEVEVLKGARRILMEHRPFIAVETHTDSLYDEVDRLLSGFGYYQPEKPGVKAATHFFIPD